MKRFALVASVALGCWLAQPGQADAARMALLVGNDDGRSPDVHLRYAQSDAARLSTLLGRVGGFPADSIVVLAGRTASDLRRALADLSERLRTTPGEHVAVVFYSGHADGQSLHLGGSSFSMVELREAVAALPAAVRVLILDACQSGVLTRAKGGVPGPGFSSALQEGERVRGLAVLAASAASELAQESDDLGGAIFTHYLQAGLSGLADTDGDGGVTLGEVFDYTSERTLAATMGTTTGPQHPTFHVDLEGTHDLQLTRPGARGASYGHLRLDAPGWYFIRRADGTIAAEVVSRGGEQLALDAGTYEVSRRGNRSLEVATLSITDGEATPVSGVPTRLVVFGRLVRKGGGPELAYGLSAATLARTPLASLGTSLGLALAARADLPALSLELRISLGRAHAEEARLSSTTWETTVSVAALHLVDFGAAGRVRPLTAGLGLEFGLGAMAQTLDAGDKHRSFSPFAGPTALAELGVGRRYFLRAAISAPLYALRVTDATGASATLWRPALTAGLGGGAWF